MSVENSGGNCGKEKRSQQNLPREMMTFWLEVATFFYWSTLFTRIMESLENRGERAALTSLAVKCNPGQEVQLSVENWGKSAINWRISIKSIEIKYIRATFFYLECFLINKCRDKKGFSKTEKIKLKK